MPTSAGGEMKQSAEQLPGIRVVPVESAGELSEYGSGIRRLRYDALNTEENKGPWLRRRGAVSEIKKSFKRPADHDVAYVAMDGEDVVGFLAVEKTPAGKRADIRQLWTSLPGHPQRAVIAKLIGAAKHYLTDRGYPRLTALRISPSADFRVIKDSPVGGRYLRMKDPEALEDDPMDIAVAEEEFETPEAANDNATTTANDNEPPAALEKAA